MKNLIIRPFKIYSEKTKFEKLAISSSIVAAAIGLFFTCCAQNGEWFARSGAAISAIAVWFASLDLKGKIDAAPDFFERLLARYKPELETYAINEGQNQLEAEKTFAIVSDDMRQDVAEISKEYVRRFLNTELSLFIVGTIVWGFGDLPFRFLFGWKG